MSLCLESLLSLNPRIILDFHKGTVLPMNKGKIYYFTNNMVVFNIEIDQPFLENPIHEKCPLLFGLDNNSFFHGLRQIGVI